MKDARVIKTWCDDAELILSGHDVQSVNKNETEEEEERGEGEKIYKLEINW